MQGLRERLGTIRVDDPVARRQAILLQVMLIAMSGAFLLAAVSNALSVTAGGAASAGLVSNLIAAAIAFVLVVVLRRGYFRAVAALTVGLLVFAFGAALAASGVAAAGPYLALLMLPLVLAGLILPRAGLFLTTIAVLAAGFVGSSVNAAAPGSLGNFLYATVLIAIVVDQFGGTVRTALGRAIAREQELETAQKELQDRTDELQGRTSELQTRTTELEAEMVERQRSEDARRAMEGRVLEVQKLESLGVLAGGIAHDFNNLLVGIMGNASLALTELPPGSAARERVMEIELAARRAGDLAGEMLAYSGRGRFVVAPHDLNQLVGEMTRLLQVSIGKSITLRYDLTNQPLVVEADATQLRQVVMNLVVNASDAIADSVGTITVSTGRIHADRSYLGATLLDEDLEEGDYAYLEVSDTGSGMDAETQARIFDPFFTTKFTGRGLGLAAVLGIVRGHRGALKVYSEIGRGSTFKLLLPASNAPAAVAVPSASSDRSWRGHGTVLVVDDEPVVREVAKAMLARMGLVVELANSGKEAVELFTADPSRFRLILLDLTMPGMSGADTFREIRAISENAKIVLMSGFTEDDASGRFAGKGLAGFLEKPFSLHELDAIISRVLEPALDTHPPSRA